MKENIVTNKLNKYTLENKDIYTGFSTYNEAEEYASEIGGKVVEVGFTDGNDNPKMTNTGKLIEKKLHYFVDAGSGYQFLHSSNPEFIEYAGELQSLKSKNDGISLEEKYMSNGEVEIEEDPIIVLKNGKFDSVTSRERSKYLKQANVYEIGVEKTLPEGI